MGGNDVDGLGLSSSREVVTEPDRRVFFIRRISNRWAIGA